MVSTYAENEQNFNAVERVLYYAKLPKEGDATTPNDPPASWPECGEIKFKDVEMAYRPGLPNVLKGVTFDVRPGEKVGFLCIGGTNHVVASSSNCGYDRSESSVARVLGRALFSKRSLES